MKDSFYNLSSRNYNFYFWNIHPFFTKDHKLRSTISSSITGSCRNPKGLNTILHHSNHHHSSNISPIEILKSLWMKGGKFLNPQTNNMSVLVGESKHYKQKERKSWILGSKWVMGVEASGVHGFDEGHMGDRNATITSLCYTNIFHESKKVAPPFSDKNTKKKFGITSKVNLPTIFRPNKNLSKSFGTKKTQSSPFSSFTSPLLIQWSNGWYFWLSQIQVYQNYWWHIWGISTAKGY